MEQQINIAELLKDCPRGTELYLSLCGKCKLKNIDLKSPFSISLEYPLLNGGGWATYELQSNGKRRDDGECLLFPSKEVRDWGLFKVSYVKGRKEDEDDNYSTLEVYLTTVLGGKINPKTFVNFTSGEKYIYVINRISGYIEQYCTDFEIAKYILATGTELKLEEEQPKFKVRDVVATKEHTTIGMVERLVCDGAFINCSGESTTTCRIDEIRLATPKEIAKWNKGVLEPNRLHYSKSKRKIIHWFLPFDRVIAKNFEDADNPARFSYACWCAQIFSHYARSSDYPYHCLNDSWKRIIPYNEKTAKLIGTTDDYEEE